MFILIKKNKYMRYGCSVLTIIYMATFVEKFLYKLNLLNRILNFQFHDE